MKGSQATVASAEGPTDQDPTDDPSLPFAERGHARPLLDGDAFSYACQGCGGCCRDKIIPVNPYEVLRLARARGLSTTELLADAVHPSRPSLRFDERGWCSFFEQGRCGVHLDRPLACRLYPLGRQRDAQGHELYWRLQPREHSPGVYGEDGRVADYLAGQDVAPHIAAANRYQALYYRVHDLLAQLMARAPTADPRPHRIAALVSEDEAALFEVDMPGFQSWFDIDAVVDELCRRRRTPKPADLDALVDLHIEAVQDWLDEAARAI
ncbi:MAG: YkgJ family cysteine cluster protein [Burkholderiaceae bacterium]